MELTWSRGDIVRIWHQPNEGPFEVIEPFEKLNQPFDTVRGYRVEGYVVVRPASGNKKQLRYHQKSIASSFTLGSIASLILVSTLLG